MTSLNSGSLILKTDRRGRIRIPRDQRDKVLDEFDRSGLSGAQFAKLLGIKYQTFAYWRAARQREGSHLTPAIPSPATPPAMKWIETVLEKSAPDSLTSGLVLRLPSGATVQVASDTQVPLAAAFIRAWEKLPC
jgi:hypothetical protein